MHARRTAFVSIHPQCGDQGGRTRLRTGASHVLRAPSVADRHPGDYPEWDNLAPERHLQVLGFPFGRQSAPSLADASSMGSRTILVMRSSSSLGPRASTLRPGTM